MTRKYNFKHIAVRKETREAIDKYLDELSNIYQNPTYDELIKLFLEKHKNISFSESEIKRILWDSKKVKK